MTKNNQYDGLNYQEKKYSPIDDFSKWYAENGTNPKIETRIEVEILRDQFNRDPESLSPTQRLILGFAELAEKNEKQLQERQKAEHDRQQELSKQKEADSVEASKVETLEKQLAELQTKLAELAKGGGGE